MVKKKHVETILARGKNFRFVQVNEVKIECWNNVSEISTRYYMSLKIPFLHRWFFEEIALNREYIKKYCYDLNNILNFVCCR